MKKSIILANQRTGSGYMRAWLDNISDVEFYTELFLAKNYEYSSFNSYIRDRKKRELAFKFFNLKKLPRVSNNMITNYIIKDYLDRVFYEKRFPKNSFKNEYHPRNTDELTLIGFKVMYDQIKNNKPLINYIRKNNTKVIHLHRSNILKLIVSKELKKITNIAHSYTNDEKINDQQVYINISTLLKKMRSFDYQTHKFDKFFESHNKIKFSFEDFLTKNTTRETLLEFLELPKSNVNQVISMKKTNQQSLESSIKNYNEVYKTLINTEFAYCLND